MIISVPTKFWGLSPLRWSCFIFLSPMLCVTLFLSHNLLIPSYGHATPVSMAFVCNPPIADSHPYKSIFRLDFQYSQTPAPSDAIASGYAARFNLTPADQPNSDG